MALGARALALLAGLALAPGAAWAGELYRCTAPDGSVRFTDDAGACPGARPHEPRRDVQRFHSPPAASRAPGSLARPAAAPAPAEEAAGEAAWRQRLAQARAERARLEAELARMERALGWCNRGGLLLRKDRAGLNRTVRCEEVRAAHAHTASELARVRGLLDGGLAEECRRAGCLPGWLR